MSSKADSPRGFSYALQPVLLMHRWKCERLQRELDELNVELRTAALKAQQAALRVAEAQQDWGALAVTEQDPGAYLRAHGFLARLDAERSAAHGLLRELEQQRTALIDTLAQAQRELDGVKRHRQRARDGFVKQALRKQYRETDDIWIGRALAGERR